MTARALRGGLLLLAAAVAPAAPAADPPAAPLPVAERMLSHGPRRTRVSLFDNRVAVVAVREGDRVTVRRLTLYEHEYAAVLRVLEIAAADRPTGLSSDRLGETAPGQILLSLDHSRAPERIPYSPLAMPDLRTQQLLAALDDVERLVSQAPPRADEVRAWEPAAGDRVRLWDDGLGTVVELLPEGFVVVQRDVTFIREVVPPGGRERMISAVLERAAP